MSHPRRLLLLTAGLLAAGIVATARAGPIDPDTLTVAECIAIAREHAPARVAAGHLQLAAERDSAAEALNDRPEVSLRSAALVAPSGSYDPAITNLGEYELKAALEWPLTDGGARGRARTRSGLESSSARWRAAVESRDAGLRAGELALRAQRLAESESLLVRNLEWLDGLASLVRGGVAAGQRGSADSIRVALERDAIVSALEDERLEQWTASLELRALLDRRGERQLVIRRSPGAEARAPDEADSLRLVALAARRPEVALARIEEQQRQLELEDARRRGAPAVDLSLDAGLAGADLTRSVPEALRVANPEATIGDRLRQDLGASVAVHLSWPVLDASRRPRIEARRAAFDAAAATARASAELEQRRARALFAEWRSADRRLRAAEITAARAERNLLKAKSLYAAGAISLLELLDARRVFDEARDRRAQARVANEWAQLQAEEWR